MATVTNNFNTGLAAGTVITTANSDDNGAGTAFDLISAAGTKTFQTRDSGLYGLFTSVGSGQAYCENSTSVGSIAAGNPVYGSADILLPALPASGSGGTRIALVLTSADVFIAEWRINDAGRLEQRTGAAALTNTSTASVTAGQWFKVHISIVTISATVGQLQCRLFLDPNSSSPTETLTSAANLNLGSTAAAKYRFGTCRTLTDFATGVDNVRWSSTSQLALGASILIGPVAGAVTSSGFTVAYRTTDGAGLNHRLVVSTNSGLTSPVYSSPVVPDADGFVKLPITGLTADTAYFYGLEVNASLLTSGRGELRTDPTSGSPANFSVAFGSCQYDTPTTGTFTAIRDYAGPNGQVRRLIHMGDLNYQDWTGSDTAADMIAQHQTSLASASMSPLLAEVPITYAWDNHDWAGSFSDKTAAAGALVASTYRQVFPSYTLPATDGKGIWHTWVIGRVRFIQIDPRSQRDAYDAVDGPSKTMLGVEQKAWLKARLQDPEPVKIICGNMYWRQDSLSGDRWGSYPDEFDELNDFIDASAVGLVYVIFGDRHALAADDGSTAETRGRPQAGGAPFQQGSTASSETWSEGYYDDPGTQESFGLLHINDTGSSIVIDYEGKTSDDLVTRVSMTTVVHTPTGIGTGEAFGLPTATLGTTTVTTTGVPSVLAFGVPTVAQQLVLVATSVPPAAAFGTPAVTTGQVTVTATGVATGAAFGTPTVAPGQVTVTATGLGSDLAFGVPTVDDPNQTLTATGVPSAEGFGLATITGAATIVATSIPSTAGVGTPFAYTGAITITATGIGSILDFGTPAVDAGDVTVVASSVEPGVAWGLPSVTPPPPPSQTLSPTGVTSGLLFGAPSVIIGSVTVRATSVADLAALGVPSLSLGQFTITAVGIASGEAFGDTHIIGGNSGQVVAATSVPSGELFGSDVLAFTGGDGNDCECAVLVGN